MIPQSQYLTLERGRQSGLSGLRERLSGGGLSPMGPQELFELGGARSPPPVQGTGQARVEVKYRGALGWVEGILQPSASFRNPATLVERRVQEVNPPPSRPPSGHTMPLTPSNCG